MPIIKSAKKAARQAVKRTEHNQQIKKDIKAALKEFRSNPTAKTLSKVQSEYDKAAKKGLMKKNTASRRKAAVAKIAKIAGVGAGATAKKTVAESSKPAAKTTAAKSTAKSAKATTTKKTAAKTTAKKPAAKKPAAKAKADKK